MKCKNRSENVHVLLLYDQVRPLLSWENKGFGVVSGQNVAEMDHFLRVYNGHSFVCVKNASLQNFDHRIHQNL